MADTSTGKRKRDDDRRRKEKNHDIGKFMNNIDNQARRAKPKVGEHRCGIKSPLTAFIDQQDGGR